MSVHRLFTAVALGRRTLVVSLALALSSCCGVTAFGQPNDPGATPRALVEKLQASLAAYSEESRSLIEALTGLGEAALPAVEEGLALGDDTLSRALVRVLGGIGGDDSTRALLSVVASAPSSLAAHEAVGRLENREVRGPLSPAELNALTTLISDGHVFVAGSAARVLGRCIDLPAELRVNPALSRFRQEVLVPTPLGSTWPSIVSPRVTVLNEFLLAFSYIGEPAIAPLWENRRDSADPELRKWLALALGMAGDPSVSGELEEMVRSDPDRYVRCVAVRAYARSAGEEAIPLLVALLEDTTESEYRDCTGGPPLVIRDAARSALSGLGRADLWMGR